MSEQQNRDHSDTGHEGTDAGCDGRVRKVRHSLLGGKPPPGRTKLRFTLDRAAIISMPSHPAFEIDRATGRILIDPDMPPLAPRYRAYIPITRFLAGVLEQKPNARI